MSTIYTKSRETTNNRRKTAARKARRFLQRFLYAKIVSYPCSSGQWLTLFLTLALFQAEGAGSQEGCCPETIFADMVI